MDRYILQKHMDKKIYDAKIFLNIENSIDNFKSVSVFRKYNYTQGIIIIQTVYNEQIEASKPFPRS